MKKDKTVKDQELPKGMPQIVLPPLSISLVSYIAKSLQTTDPMGIVTGALIQEMRRRTIEALRVTPIKKSGGKK